MFEDSLEALCGLTVDTVARPSLPAPHIAPSVLRPFGVVDSPVVKVFSLQPRVSFVSKYW